MRTLSAGMAGHVAGTAHTRCNMLLIVLQDGTSIGITDHEKDLDFDVIGDGTVTYSARTGVAMSDLALSASLDADNFEARGPLNDTFTFDGITGGRFDRARVHRFQVNWKDLSLGSIDLLAGNITEARTEGGEFILEIRSDMDRYNSEAGRVITNNCWADFADGVFCHATATEITGTVIAVTSALLFRVSFVGSYAANFFNQGKVTGLTGANSGVAVEIFDWAADGSIELLVPLASIPEIGDTFNVRDGCGKAHADCMAHNQIEDFRGYHGVPGRKALLPAIPGQGND